ncbi:hypothetical protein [Micromonospora sp. 15K316]|uniref:hypothetical protein n=1 Tax=Micromonospora sp. 15K316 TaxID=2530376 RepID=UPI0014053AC7|nr:hypothetical protein [Micromonospora sp. 15K316]
MANNSNSSDSAIPSVTETLRLQAQEQRDKANGVETAASRRTARMIAAQNRR